VPTLLVKVSLLPKGSLTDISLVVRRDPNRGAWAAVAMVLGQVQHAIVPRHLHIKRESGLESMLPIEVEPKELHIELPRLFFVEDPKNRSCFSKTHAVLLVH
jgi:hypothetical protein